MLELCWQATSLGKMGVFKQKKLEKIKRKQKR
jgi:hypothetical protein